MVIIRSAGAAALTLALSAALIAITLPDVFGEARAQQAQSQQAQTQQGLPQQTLPQEVPAALVAQPVSLPDMALGSAKAPVTITEYSSMSCPHCAAFGQNVFPMLRSKYIDTGKVRFVFREFPLDIKAAAASMLARCIANGDAEKYFGTVQLLFQQQEQLMAQTKNTLNVVGKQAGMSAQAVETCARDQVLLDKLAADQRFALQALKVVSTPTFFVNDRKLQGVMSFEELEAIIKPMLKK